MLSQASTLARSAGEGQISEPWLFDTAQEAWLASLSHLLRQGQLVFGVQEKYSVGSGFGEKNRNTKELSAASFSISSPRRRLIYSERRPVDIGFAIANAIWVLTGSDDVEMISFYNPRGKCFSDDGIRLFSAPGARIFGSPEGDQFQQAARRLKNDPTTRRAVIQVFSSSDSFADTRDFSCITSLQFLLRRNVLSCITYMRSQSALMVMPYDIFLLSTIHEALAMSINAEPGAYRHFCGSLHYYEDEEALVQAVIDEAAPSPFEMPAMHEMSAGIRAGLAVAEKDIRHRLAEDFSSSIDTNRYELDRYWTELLRVMVAGVRSRHGVKLSDRELLEIPEPYRPYFTPPINGNSNR